MTFYFYDLETSGRDPRSHRIMQFAGQRTDENLRPIGDPYVATVKLTDDVLPEPEAVLLTGITPQQTLSEGIDEAAFIKKFQQEVVKPDTCIVGFNNVRFDDEFMRFSLWRNFYDAYEWQWKDGCCRWDLIDMVRMTRALRPDGIKWPTTEDGRASNRLEELTELNGLDHANAHDALSDVQATIAVAKLFKEKQPKLFEYLYSICKKNEVMKLLQSGVPFVHTSGMVSSDFLKTSIFLPIVEYPGRKGSYLIYDLRFDPSEFTNMTVPELRDRLFKRTEELNGKTRLPVKGVHANKCPAIAPLGVLDAPTQERIGITLSQMEQNLRKLSEAKGFVSRILEAWTGAETQSPKDKSKNDVDGALYDGFLGDQDRYLLQEITRKSAADLVGYAPVFSDARLKELYFRYKARNYTNSLTPEEREQWEEFRKIKLLDSGQFEQFGKDLQRLATERTDEKSQFLLEELHLYGESILPSID